MFEITSHNAAEYLRSSGRASADEPIDVRELAGGVSNVVLLVTLPDCGERFVIKQARERLRVKEKWLCPVERIWREVEVLQLSGKLLRTKSAEIAARSETIAASVPAVLWEDRENFAYTMSAAPTEHRTGKELLLAGPDAQHADLARACGRMLGRLHAGSWLNESIATSIGDCTFFDQLRLDPYYRHTARVHADLAGPISRLVDSVWQHSRALVHGDFSPKNLLVWPGHVMLIDFEVGHYGDPAFDLGFFLTHLVLKSFRASDRQADYLAIATTFWQSYRQVMAAVIAADELTSLEARLLWNLAGCLLARIDGKSPVDYLSSEQQQRTRNLARNWIIEPPRTWNEAARLSVQY
jgi:5-methylthioribose kinase